MDDIAKLVKGFKQEVREKAIDEVFEFLKSKRDTRELKVNLDDFEIRKYKEQLKGGEK